jgi:hypothetical protein
MEAREGALAVTQRERSKVLARRDDGTERLFRMAAGALLLGATLALASACTPTVKVEAPKEPITINLNVKLDAEVRVKLEEQAREDIQENPDIF